MFSLKNPYYCRFENHTFTKNNFANIFVNVAGVNLGAKAALDKPSVNGRGKILPRLANS
jgi:hypothetical protein